MSCDMSNSLSKEYTFDVIARKVFVGGLNFETTEGKCMMLFFRIFNKLF